MDFQLTTAELPLGREGYSAVASSSQCSALAAPDWPPGSDRVADPGRLSLGKRLTSEEWGPETDFVQHQVQTETPLWWIEAQNAAEKALQLSGESGFGQVRRHCWEQSPRLVSS